MGRKPRRTTTTAAIMQKDFFNSIGQNRRLPARFAVGPVMPDEQTYKDARRRE